ncbi:hypothetical protein MJG53_014357 [Ovis ammon polii x Ovis aries]|uniref:Uncharacterized protein n=1 Tax=Ovis ammon polii x Ovis aries TaxID=2918886 RepID=A0ACB9UGC1_9CETA|nr:hypothetical protein MJG53_014357 [Ovis ammon polii x Ovis aries]
MAPHNAVEKTPVLWGSERKAHPQAEGGQAAPITQGQRGGGQPRPEGKHTDNRASASDAPARASTHWAQKTNRAKKSLFFLVPLDRSEAARILQVTVRSPGPCISFQDYQSSGVEANAGEPAQVTREVREQTWDLQRKHQVQVLLTARGALVRSLVQEDHTGHGATKPVCLSYGSHRALEPVLHKRSHQKEKPAHRNWRKRMHSNEDPVQP